MGYDGLAVYNADRALELVPRYAPAYGLKGDISSRSDFKEALYNYRAAKTLDPSNAEIYNKKIKQLKKIKVKKTKK